MIAVKSVIIMTTLASFVKDSLMVAVKSVMIMTTLASFVKDSLHGSREVCPLYFNSWI